MDGKRKRFYSEKSKVPHYKSVKVGKGYKILFNDSVAIDFDECIKSHKLKLVDGCQLFQQLLIADGVQFIKFLKCDQHFKLFRCLLAGSKIVMCQKYYLELSRGNYECSICMKK